MNIKKSYIILATMLATAIPSPAQSLSDRQDTDSRPDAIERIMAESHGNVEIILDDELRERILTPPVVHKKSSGDRQGLKPGINKGQGYRIQVFFDGRNQHSLESRAKARGNAILAKFPRYRGQVYTFSSSPNWYCRVGNFRSASEAENALEQLKRAFPSFANEMRVVKCQITIIK